MPLSKLWLFLLSMLCGLGALLLMTLEPELRRRESDEQQARLLRAGPLATQILSNQAHQLVAAAVQMSSDAILQTSLNEMGRGQGELAILHTTAQTQLRQLNRDFGAGLVMVTDARGRVLARIGHDEAVYRDPVDGFPVVESALRGYRLDDLWLLDGALYRVAASPIVAPNRDRYVGALIVGQVLGSDTVRLLSRMTGVDAVFLAGKDIAASSLTGPAAGLDVQAILAARKSMLAPGASPSASQGQGGLLRAPQPGPERWLGFVELPGEASHQGGLLLLVAEVTPNRTLPGLLRDAVQHGKPTQSLLGLLGVVALFYFIGLAILRVESTALAQREAAAEVRRRRVEQPRAELRPSSGSMREPLATSAASSASSVSSVSDISESQIEEYEPQEAGAASGRRALSSQSVNELGVVSASENSAHSAETVVASPMRWAAETANSGELAHEADPAASDQQWGNLPPPSSNFEPTLVAGAPGGNSEITDADASFYQVFQEYVMARERCHESVEGLSYEQFRQRLVESRAQIMRQHECRAVDFQVYIKDGRAALRATPLWK